MWRKIRPILLATSLALNVAILAGWAARTTVRSTTSGTPAAAEGESEIWSPLHRELAVTTSQWREIEPGLVQFRRQMQETCRDIRERREEMLALLAIPAPEKTAIQAQQQRVQQAQGEMQRLVLNHILSEKKVLTAEQEDKLFAMIRQRMGCPGPVRMMVSDPEAASDDR